MNKEIIESYFIFNGSQYAVDRISEIELSQPSIYEVVRVIDSVPLFLEEHMERLQKSAMTLQVQLNVLLPQIVADMQTLIKLNTHPEKNIKLIVFNIEKAVPDYIMCFIKSSYPSKEQYDKGVHTILMHAERHNPNAKVINNELRELSNKKMAESNAYEALLVNDRGEITEGSRSNLFFLVQGKIYTAPAQDVLIGITRKYIEQACLGIGLEIVEQPIPFSMLDYAEAAFITGTSPKVLPIATIEERQLNSASNPTIQGIITEYNRILEKYIHEHKKG